jgi:outer membrane protein OmpA-like peptidoglycan-associated protein
MTDFHSSTGLGQFDAALEPPARMGAPAQLVITLNLNFHFLPLRSPRWTPNIKEAYRYNVARIITDTWSNRFALRPHGRRSSDPRVEVRIDVGTTEVGPIGSEHFHVTVQETTNAEARDHVRPSPLTSTHVASTASLFEREPEQAVPDVAYNPLDTSGSSGSLSALPVANLDQPPIEFASNSAALTSSDQARLAQLATALDQSPYRWEIRLVGRASADEQGGDSLALARARTAREALGVVRRGEVVAVPGGVTTAPQGRVLIVSGRIATRQRIAAHEAGHMFGLDDEYVETDPARLQADPTRRPEVPVRHSNLALETWRGRGIQRGPGSNPARLRLGEGGLVLRGTDPSSLMAGGTEVLPRHYVTFVEACARLTGTAQSDWQIDRN